ncbi:MAG TPA: prepilin peptidase [Candidatus Blautia avistercoris]|uniref:hypothetical protein n=1 Tax=Blautia sp. An249 TaxID=1965603 RepID=UPI000B37E7E7|nr:hypothetical protein [Blautia sp. An249]OUO79045.1 hypothetical protein B5F53_08180 [Blautia sp. An249]HIY19146.1 prepilin peptidase [Candidatus Blautia avistercoris]
MDVKVVCVIGILGYNAWKDWKLKEISLWSLLFINLMGMGLCMGNTLRENQWGELALGYVPGIALIGLSILTKGKIGMGDGLILLSLGNFMRIKEVFLVLGMGLLLCSFWSGILLVARKAGKNSRIPFVPFLFAGYLGGLWLWKL